MSLKSVDLLHFQNIYKLVGGPFFRSVITQITPIFLLLNLPILLICSYRFALAFPTLFRNSGLSLTHYIGEKSGWRCIPAPDQPKLIIFYVSSKAFTFKPVDNFTDFVPILLFWLYFYHPSIPDSRLDIVSVKKSGWRCTRTGLPPLRQKCTFRIVLFHLQN